MAVVVAGHEGRYEAVENVTDERRAFIWPRATKGRRRKLNSLKIIHGVNEGEQRAKALSRCDSRCHGPKDGAALASCQAETTINPAAGQVSSRVRKEKRPVGVGLLTEAIGDLISKVDLAAVIDVQRKHLDEMLACARPWPIEAFVLVGERRPDVAVEVEVAYARLLPTPYLERLIERLKEMLAERKAKENS